MSRVASASLTTSMGRAGHKQASRRPKKECCSGRGTRTMSRERPERSGSPIGVAATVDDVLTTTGSGGFVVWRGRNYLRSVDGAHDDAIADLSLVSGETLVPLLATCEGTKIKIWKAESLEIVMQLDLTTIPAIGTATTVSLHKSGSKVLVGTSERELYELSALGEGALEPKEEEEEGGPQEEVPVRTRPWRRAMAGITDFL